MTDPHQFHRNRASFRWALGALADALDEYDLPTPHEVAIREDSDRIHVFVTTREASPWCGALSGLELVERVPLSEKLDGTHYDATGRLGAARVMVTWYDPTPRELPRPRLEVVDTD